MNAHIEQKPMLAKTSLRGLITDVFYCICTFSFLLWGRYDFIVSPLALNPDEFQAGANVLRILQYGFNWDTLDSTTVGPLNSLILAWPYLLAQEITTSTIRLTAFFLLFIIVAGSYFILASLSRRFYAIAFTLPLATFYALNTNYEFQHYSSELLPTALLILACSFLINFYKKTKLRQSNVLPNLMAIGLSLGAVPFAKIQAAPIGVTIALFSFYFIYKHSPVALRLQRLTIFTLSGLTPVIAISAPLVLQGTFHHLWNSYIVWPTLYVNTPLTFFGLYQLIAQESYLVGILWITVISLLTVLLLAIKTAKKITTTFWPVFFLAIVGAATFAVMRPGNVFPHYLMFIPPFALILCGVLLSKAEPAGKAGYVYNTVIFLMITGCTFPEKSENNPQNQLTQANDFEVSSPRIFDYLGAEKNDNLLIWGWMPRWYLYSGMAPASRESMTNNQQTKSRLQNYFRDRLISDIDTSKPAYIIDAVIGNSFRFNDPSKVGLPSFRELQSVIQSNYTEISGLGRQSNCATTYIRNDRFNQASDSLVKFKNITASAEMSQDFAATHIDDFSVTEDTCTDFWLLPNNTPGYVDIEFTDRESVAKINVLNTRNSYYLDRGALEVNIILYNNGERVFSEPRTLATYPHWNEIALKSPVIADTARIEILSSVGHGGGLNEVKITRSTSQR